MNRKINLLVVDGSRTTIRYIDSIFGGYCQIHLARTGIEAMDVVEIKPIDIIIITGICRIWMALSCWKSGIKKG